MGASAVLVRELQVDLDHRQAAVPEQPLQSEHIPTVPQVLNRESVPEPVGMCVINPGPITQPAHQVE